VHEHIIKLDLKRGFKTKKNTFILYFFSGWQKFCRIFISREKQKKQKLVKWSAPLIADLPLTLDPLRREKKMKKEKNDY
jgi:hypothetical protein